MDITEVRIKLMEDSDDRLRAFCSITFDDCFVVRDLKIIDGSNGPFVAMPSRKLTTHCGRCRSKNHLRAAFCNHCGAELDDDRTVRDSDGRVKLYADIAHPINSRCREMIQNRVILDYQDELKLAEQPGYVSRYDEGYDEDSGPEDDNYDEQSRRSLKGKTAHVEQAESTPPPPHQPQRSAEKKSSDAGDAGGFGAGIFE